MRFNTHSRTQKTELQKSVKIMFTITLSLFILLFLFAAIVCSLYINSIVPAIIMLVTAGMSITLFAITKNDMNKAFIEIVDDKISVTDYYFGIKKEKTFSAKEISTAETVIGYSMRIHGYSYPGCTYIVFKNKSNKYIFKVIYSPETEQFFGGYLK